MEGAVKHLREGCVRQELGSPIGVVCDGVDVVGGRDCFAKMCHQLISAVQHQRAQASKVVLVTIEKAWQTYVPQEYAQAVEVVDAHGDPYGWHGCPASSSAPNVRPLAVFAEPHEGVNPPATSPLQQLESMLLQPRHISSSSSRAPAAHPSDVSTSSASDHSCCIIIDNLTPLLLHFGPGQVMRLLDVLRHSPHTSCILTAVHSDLHPPHVVSGLHRAASCVASLSPLQPLQLEVASRAVGHAPHGTLSFRYKRKTGRVKAESVLYTLMRGGEVQLNPLPPGLDIEVTAEALVALAISSSKSKNSAAAAAAAAAAGGAAGTGSQPLASTQSAGLLASASGATATQPSIANGEVGSAADAAKVAAGGMKLTLSEEERKARERVVLPYEHQGQAQAYQTGDFRDYLPVAAGGKAGGQALLGQAAGSGTAGQAAAGDDGGVARLGRILYVRDSEEEHDSDEDPDDDLDI